MTRRRDLLILLGGAAAWPTPSPAQQVTPRVVGFLRRTPSGPFANLVAAFRKGLTEAGFVEGQNVKVEYHWADNQLDRLPELAAELVRQEVVAIVGNGLAVRAARAATSTIPIVFVLADDPVASGLVASLNQPGGNITGVTFFAGAALNLERLEVLHEITPTGRPIAVRLDPNYPEGGDLAEVEAAARSLGRTTACRPLFWPAPTRSSSRRMRIRLSSHRDLMPRTAIPTYTSGYSITSSARASSDCGMSIP